MLTIRQLTVRYGSHEAVSKLDLTVNRGDIVCLLGPNGAGKSSLLQAVVGITPKQQGRVVVDSHDSESAPLLLKSKIGIAAQPVFLYDFLTTEEFVEFVSEHRSGDESAKQALDAVGLADRCNTLCRELSYGMRQRTALAAAIRNNPPLILLDETINGLDPVAAKLARETLRERAQSGCAIVLSTHLLGATRDLCSRIVVMNAGAIVGDVDGDELTPILSRGERGVEEFYLQAIEQDDHA